MYHDFFGIAENPFSITPDPRYLFMSKGHEEALAHLLYGVSVGGGFVLLTGEVGTGKTSVCRCLLEQLPETAAVALILNPRLNEIELLASICDELGVSYPNETRSLKVLVDRLNRHLLELHAAGRHGVVIIDEAQDLSPQVLEQVRLLTNLETPTRKLLQVILIGQPELNALLQRDDLRQVVQRVTARYHLQPLGRADTQAYVQHRLSVGGLAPDLFSGRAIAAVYRRARGVPRLINSLCDRCLLCAYTQNRKAVDARLVRRAAREVFGRSVKRRRGVPAMLAWAGATAAFAGALLVLDPLDLGLLPQAAGWRAKLETFVVGGVETTPEEARERADSRQSNAEPVDGRLDAAASGGQPDSPAIAVDSRVPQTGVAQPDAAIYETANGASPVVHGAETAPGPEPGEAETEAATPPVVTLPAAVDIGPPADARVETQADANGEPPAEAMATPRDDAPAADEAGVLRSKSDPEPPAEVVAAMSAELDSEPSGQTAAGAPGEAEGGPLGGAVAGPPAETFRHGAVETEETAPVQLVLDPLALPSAAERPAVAEAEPEPARPGDTSAEARTVEARTVEAQAVEAQAFEAQAVEAQAVEARAANGAGDGSALQTARNPGVEQTLTIDDLFNRPSLSVGRDSALAALFGLWGLDAQRLGGPVDCAKSAELGVKCLTEKISWETLIGFNRPVLIALRNARGRRARVVLSAVEGDQVTLLAGSERIVGDIATVRSLWSGEYLMLWQPPPFYGGLLALGARGQEVAWLKSRLAEADGEPQIEGQDAVFDAGLQEKVKAFQQSRGLEPDGMVGVRTLIHLNTAAKAAGVPLLRPSAP
jgi:type II secretory pathway predicted ATPase ExeA